jgi:hypothetical protein
MSDIKESIEYTKARKYLEGKAARRSGQPYIKHIDEGLALIPEHAVAARKAFCLHALLQSDEDFLKNYNLLQDCNTTAVALAMEYRSVANVGTREKFLQTGKLTPSVSYEVNLMLLADKKQNMLDCVAFQHDNPDYESLMEYFKAWITLLTPLVK